MKLNEKIFREYDIRGIADVDLPDSVVLPLGRALATLMRQRGAKRITLGRDCRLSSPRLHASLTEAFVGCGLEVIDIGLVPTPLLYFSVFNLDTDGGVMITGSHNPGEHNGFKICIGKTTIHGEDIQKIKHLLLKGDFISGKGSRSETNVVPAYWDCVVSSIQHPLAIKVVVDSGNGMAGPVAVELYKRLGCEVIDLFSTPDGNFPNHHPDPSELKNLVPLIAEVKQSRAPAGIAFDGDADRIGVVDISGKAIFGDELLVIYARDVLKTNPGATIISEVKASHRFFQDVTKHGGRPIMWKTGHSLIKAKMKEEKALLAGEMSGHMFFNDRYFGYDDAIYAGARLLEILAREKTTPSKLLVDLPHSYSTPELRVDCPDEKKFEVVAAARSSLERAGHKVNGIDGARVEFADGWGLVRASNTQPVLVYRFEASSEKRLGEIRKLIESTVAGLISG